MTLSLASLTSESEHGRQRVGIDMFARAGRWGRSPGTRQEGSRGCWSGWSPDFYGAPRIRLALARAALSQSRFLSRPAPRQPRAFSGRVRASHPYSLQTYALICKQKVLAHRPANSESEQRHASRPSQPKQQGGIVESLWCQDTGRLLTVTRSSCASL